ncbi:aldehyde dehydrogenase family protein [Micromonospora sp. NPDC023966]|uniref:aldehyde dehydrogenase family protein n=1 Tax=Micromonospora sp. NPDC023966 TaxID=3154699 RepID=UPI0033E550E2
MIASVDPHTGQEVARFPALAPAEVDAALTAAVRAQAQWRQRGLAARLALLRDLAAVLRAGKRRYARLITAEMGKPLGQAEAEIEKCALTCEHYAAHAPSYLADETVDTPGRHSSVVYDPLGVILAVMPWNFPFWQFFRFAVPALAAGNGALLKPAENVPRCALAIEEVWRDAGGPDGLVRSLLVEVEQVAGIVADDRVAAVTMTGSTRVGGLLAAQAGAALKKQVLELGGSDPFIVLADADVPAAAAAAVDSRFLNTGQSCVNAKRFIVADRVAEDFVAAVSERIRDLRVGDPTEPGVTVGPLARADLRDQLHDQVRRTVAEGATLVLGGAPVDGPGFHYQPTLIDHVTPAMTAFREETFGPVAAVVRVADTEEAIRLANQSEYGLGAALWTADVARAQRLARRIDAGAVFVNAMVASEPSLPFGGIKKSGYGRELGRHGILEFVNAKTVSVAPAPAVVPEPGQRTTVEPAFPPVVLRPAQLPPRERGGGARTVQLVTRRRGADSFLNGITTFAPGGAIPLHVHNCAESVVVLAGQAIVEIDGVEDELGPEDTTYVPAGVPHRFRNASATEPMRILWTYASVEATRTIVATGMTTRVDAE